MNKKQAIEETLKHWKRMINWAKKQRRRKITHGYNMEYAIGETTSSSYCALCKKYLLKEKGCNACPLDKKYGNCGNKRVKNLFRKTVDSVTWGTWVKNAEKLLKQLESLK